MIDWSGDELPLQGRQHHESLDAGEFGRWLVAIRHALASRDGIAVPCGDCVGCCTSHYSILLRPHDAALDIIPAALQASVPGMWYPHAKLKPRSDGTCPMFQSGQCSIYARRPQTCLDYDCRIFAASQLLAGEDKPVINERIAAWRFDYADDTARAAHHAIMSAAQFINEHREQFPNQWAPTNPSGLAVLSIKVYELFMPDQPARDLDTMITAIVAAARAFDAASNA